MDPAVVEREVAKVKAGLATVEEMKKQAEAVRAQQETAATLEKIKQQTEAMKAQEETAERKLEGSSGEETSANTANADLAQAIENTIANAEDFKKDDMRHASDLYLATMSNINAATKPARKLEGSSGEDTSTGNVKFRGINADLSR